MGMVIARGCKLIVFVYVLQLCSIKTTKDLTMRELTRHLSYGLIV